MQVVAQTMPHRLHEEAARRIALAESARAAQTIKVRVIVDREHRRWREAAYRGEPAPSVQGQGLCECRDLGAKRDGISRWR